MPIENEMTRTEYAKLQAKIKREKWEVMFSKQLDAEGHWHEREYHFHPERKWRFDFALEDMIAVEIEGGIWTRGRHTRGSGFIKDCEKYNTAAAMGWKVFRFTSEMVEDGSALKFLEEEVWQIKEE